jgi:hypothetical protein
MEIILSLIFFYGSLTGSGFVRSIPYAHAAVSTRLVLFRVSPIATYTQVRYHNAGQFQPSVCYQSLNLSTR